MQRNLLLVPFFFGICFLGYSGSADAKISSNIVSGAVMEEYKIWHDTARPNSYSIVFEGKRGVIGDPAAGFYRIPALVVAPNGDLLAFADERYGDNMDTGYAVVTTPDFKQALNQRSNAAEKRGDIVMRVSKDAGATWQPKSICARGNGIATPTPPNGIYAGHCDAVPVADRCSNALLFLTCSGSSNYSNNNGPNYLLCFISTNGGNNWTYKDISGQIETATGNADTHRFFGSGRAVQSKKYKFGSYYRIYAHIGIGGKGYVLYTDDFGENWKLLGTAYIDGWDEVKITEFDDGGLLIAGKAAADGKNPVTVWRYGSGIDDVKNGIGHFDKTHYISGIAGTNCNGDMIIVKAVEKSSGKAVNLVLSSYPMGLKEGEAQMNELDPIRQGGGSKFSRFNIGIKWKTFDASVSALPASSEFTSAWSEGTYYVQGKDDIEGCYSVMQELPNGKIGILYEEGPASRTQLKTKSSERPFKGYKYGDWNVIKYKELDVSAITGGAYFKP